MKFTNSETPIYKDDARTVVAFKYVIDYKLSPNNPVEVPFKDPENYYTKTYTDSFIIFTRRLLPDYDPQLHFVKDTAEFGRILDSLFVTETKTK